MLSSRSSLSPFRSPALFALHCSCRYMQKVAHTHILTLYYYTHMRLTLVYYAGAAAATSTEAEGVAAAAAADMVLSASFKARNAHPFPFYFIAKLQFICFVIFTHFTSKHTHEARRAESGVPSLSAYLLRHHDGRRLTNVTTPLPFCAAQIPLCSHCVQCSRLNFQTISMEFCMCLQSTSAAPSQANSDRVATHP